MYQTFNGNIPQKIDKDFIKLSSVYKHYTRHTINKYHLPQANTCYGHKMLSFAGVKLWSKLDPDLKSLGWLLFKKHFKRKLLQKYKAVAILPSTAIYPQRLFCLELFVIGQS